MGKNGKIWQKVGERARVFTFKGTYRFSIDHKGRLSLPVKFRDRTDSPSGDLYTVAQGYESCLYVYPRDTWDVLEQRMLQLNTQADPRARFFLRVIYPNAQDVQTDRQGRIPIPQNLLDLAFIKKDVVVRGVLDKIEIWDPEVLKKYNESQTESFEDVARQLLI
jgi:MraZ protein